MIINSVKKNAILNVVYTVTNIAFPLITYPYVTRVLLASGMGRYFFFSSFSSYSVVIGSLGLSVYGIREVARCRDDKERLSKITSELFMLNTMVNTVVLMVILAVIPFVSKLYSEPLLLFVNLLLIAASPLELSWLFSGLEQYSFIAKRNFLVKTIALVLIFILVRKPGDYPIYASIMSFSSIVSYFFNYAFSRKLTRIMPRRGMELKKHIKPMMVLFCSILSVNVYTNLDSVMLGFICGDSEVGYYSIASKVKWLLLAVVNAVSAVLLPRLSNYISNNELEKYIQTLRKSISTIFLITIPLSVFFFIEAVDVIKILGGEGFEHSIECMRCLMPILIISGFSNVTGNQILIPNGKDIYFLRAIVTGAVVDIVMNIVLMPQMGAMGAAIATLIAELSQMLIQLVYARNEICRCFNWKSICCFILGVMVATFWIICLNRLLLFHSLINLFLSAIVYFVLYFLILYIIKEETVRELFSTIKKQFRQKYF